MHSSTQLQQAYNLSTAGRPQCPERSVHHCFSLTSLDSSSANLLLLALLILPREVLILPPSSVSVVGKLHFPCQLLPYDRYLLPYYYHFEAFGSRHNLAALKPCLKHELPYLAISGISRRAGLFLRRPSPSSPKRLRITRNYFHGPYAAAPPSLNAYSSGPTPRAPTESDYTRFCLPRNYPSTPLRLTYSREISHRCWKLASSISTVLKPPWQAPP